MIAVVYDVTENVNGNEVCVLIQKIRRKIMSQTTFKALFLEQNAENVRPTFRELSVDELPEGDVLVSVAYSTLNYKDALAITNKGKIIRSFPFIPGIDFSGTVEQSQSPDFKAGDQVILTGWG